MSCCLIRWSDGPRARLRDGVEQPEPLLGLFRDPVGAADDVHVGADGQRLRSTTAVKMWPPNTPENSLSRMRTDQDGFR